MTLKALSILLALAPGTLSATQAAAQAPGYSIEDVTACSQDAMRLCKDKLPDIEQIETCMKEHYDSLRPACRARFNRE